MSNQEGFFKLNVDRIEKDILLTVVNPNYKTLLQCYSYVRGVFIDDDDTKGKLPVNIVLGASNFLEINTNMPARIGKTSEPVARLTKFGWVVMPPGQTNESKTIFK